MCKIHCIHYPNVNTSLLSGIKKKINMLSVEKTLRLFNLLLIKLKVENVKVSFCLQLDYNVVCIRYSLKLDGYIKFKFL